MWNALQPPPPREGQRAAVWYILKVLFVIFAVISALLAIGAVVVSAMLSNAFSGLGQRKHLKEIPIAATACPYVRVLHEIANDVQRNEPEPVLDASLAGQTPLAWPLPSQARSEHFREALVALDLGITIGNPHFPPAVRKYLSATQRADRRGRTEIAHTYYGFLPMHPSSDLLDSGQQSFGFAGDLVGSQCGIKLEADNNTALGLSLFVLSDLKPKKTVKGPVVGALRAETTTSS